MCSVWGMGGGECVAGGWEFEVWSGVLVESSLLRCFLCHFFKASLGVTYVQTFIKKKHLVMIGETYEISWTRG